MLSLGLREGALPQLGFNTKVRVRVRVRVRVTVTVMVRA